MNDLFNPYFLRELQIAPGNHRYSSTYPFNIAAIRNLQTLKFHPKVTYIVGENGMGKSTLLEAIAIASGFNPEGGTRNSPILMAYPDSIIYQLTEHGIDNVRLEDTDHYVVMKQFMNHKESMLSELFQEE